MKKLIDLLSALNEKTTKVENEFEVIAKELLCNYQIISVSGEKYNIEEIEFYFFNKNHKDTSVHRHNMKVGQWRVHYSGLDITFNGCALMSDKCKNRKCSKCDDLSSYGGILIRSISKSNNLIIGPLRVQTTLLSGGSINVSNGLTLKENEGCNKIEEPKSSTRCGILKTKDFGETYYCYYNDILLCDKQRSDGTNTRVAK